MRTVIETIRSIPEPYRSEILFYRITCFDNNYYSGSIQDMIMLIMPKNAARNTIIKAYLRGDLNPKAEARPEMAMPKFPSTDCLTHTEVCDHYGIAPIDNYHFTKDDLFDQEYDR